MRFRTLVIAIMVLAGCTCNNGHNTNNAEDTVLVVPDTLLLYDVDPEKKILQKHTEVPDSAFTMRRVINGLNEKYPNVQLQFLRQSNDTLYVSVPQSEYLSERMGNSGATSWYADAVWNLGSLAGVHYVNIEVEEGSHAAPGVFSTTDFPGFKIDSTVKKPDTQ